jgi:hypothetical protein
MMMMCVKIRKIQKLQKNLILLYREREKRKKTNPLSLFNLTHNDDNVCENQKNPKIQKNRILRERERELTFPERERERDFSKSKKILFG